MSTGASPADDATCPVSEAGAAGDEDERTGGGNEDAEAAGGHEPAECMGGDDRAGDCEDGRAALELDICRFARFC